MVYCVANGCTNRSGHNKPSGITFHKFPKDPPRRDLWRRAVRRKDWTPSKNAHLCSLHFKEEDVDRTSLAVVRIREGAVPSLFPAFAKEKISRTLQKRKALTEIPSLIQSAEDDPGSPEPSLNMEAPVSPVSFIKMETSVPFIKLEDEEDPHTSPPVIRYMLETSATASLKRKIITQRRQIRNLRQRHIKMKKQLQSLKHVIVILRSRLELNN